MDNSGGGSPRRLNIYFSTALVAVAIAVGIFLIFFRYQYIDNGSQTDRVDRLSGNTCVMPCLPAPPKPKDPPKDLMAQRAIVAVKEQPNVASIVENNSEMPGHFEWAAVPVSEGVRDGELSTDSSAYLVCYCKPDSTGFRWETHLATGETFYVNDNATLSHKYNVTLTEPSPTPVLKTAATFNAPAIPPIDTSGPTPQDAIVAFYHAISSKQYSAAYDMQSDAFKSGTNFQDFVAGYSTTQNVEADVHQRGDSNTVDVVLHATDLKNNQLVYTTYSGYWIVQPDGGGGWKLDQGKFSR